MYVYCVHNRTSLTWINIDSRLLFGWTYLDGLISITSLNWGPIINYVTLKLTPTLALRNLVTTPWYTIRISSNFLYSKLLIVWLSNTINQVIEKNVFNFFLRSTFPGYFENAGYGYYVNETNKEHRWQITAVSNSDSSVSSRYFHKYLIWKWFFTCFKLCSFLKIYFVLFHSNESMGLLPLHNCINTNYINRW